METSLHSGDMVQKGWEVARYDPVWQDCFDRNNMILAIALTEASVNARDNVLAPHACTDTPAPRLMSVYD
jgi:hypothetical protein